MNNEQYRANSAKSESVPKEITIDLKQLKFLLEGISIFTEALDIMKKEMFYSREPKNPLYFFDAIEQLNYIMEQDVESTTKTITDTKTIKLLHSLIGVITEGGEMPVLINQLVDDGPFDEINYKEEMGDVLWYVDRGTDAMNVPLCDLMDINIRKLAKRYPEGFFSNEKANNRDLETEYKIMSE